MPRAKLFFKQFHWKILLVRILINAAALTLTVVIIPEIYFVMPTLLKILIIAIGLGILNAIVKPIILLLTGQFIFATFGLLVVLVNALILFLLERLFNNSFVVDNFFWALVGGAVLGLVSNALENLFGLTPPIVPDEEAELRKLIEATQQASLVNLVAKPQAMLPQDVETQSLSSITAAEAVLDTLQAGKVSVAYSQPENEDMPETPKSNQQPPDESQVQGSEPIESDADENPDNTPIGGAA